MVNLEYMQNFLGVWVSVSKRIEACTENNILSNTLFYRILEFVFSVSTAGS